MFRILLGALLGFMAVSYRSFGGNPLAGVLGGPLDGSAWEVSIRRKTLLAIPRKDTLIFDNGRVSVTGKLDEGFAPAGYSAHGRLSSTAVWESALPGEDGSVLNWQGHVENDQMKGSVSWTLANGSVRRYSFRGRRKN